MTKILALLAYVAGSVGLQILVLINGWGLEPQSWWWIVGVGIFVAAIWHHIGRVVMEDKP